MDIVYILRNDIEGDELRYSLRSLKNLPHDKVWFFGGTRDDLKPDRQVYFEQKGVSVWQRVCSTIEEVCKNKEVSEDFYLFNDDFFIMKPVEEVPYYYDGTLLKRIENIKKKTNGLGSLYSRKLEETRLLLMQEHKKTYNYAVHVPMVINKKKALALLKKYKSVQMFRSVYGNYYNVGGEQMKDCKIADDREPDHDAVFLSTSEGSFEKNVGAFIKSVFTEECEYEVQHNSAVLEQREVAEEVS